MTGGTTRSAVVELRQYTLVPRARDAFVALFEQLLEPQEATGMRVLGQFRDLDRPNAFAWLRGFPDMTRRREVLEAFYGGPVWAAHRDRLNAMLIDSDDVLLLEPADPGPTLDDLTAPRPPVGTPDEPASRLLVEVSPVAPRTPSSTCAATGRRSPHSSSPAPGYCPRYAPCMRSIPFRAFRCARVCTWRSRWSDSPTSAPRRHWRAIPPIRPR
jgi:hypothetical protein